MKNRQKIGWGILGIAIVLLAGGYWWYTTLDQPKAPNQQAAHPVTSSNSDNFLPIERAPAISLESLLANSFVIPAGTDMAKIITITATGDIIPARGVDVQVRNHGVDYPFAGPGIIELLSHSDLTVVDLEAPIIDSCPLTKTGFKFCGQADFAGAMFRAGIDVATMENNHISNYGLAGVVETMQHLQDAGVRYATDTDLNIETIKGKKIGFLAFNDIEVKLDTARVKQLIADARLKVDILAVAFHWGKEYELLPMTDGSIAPTDPRQLGHIAVDAGADLIIGNHPHWVQGVELYKGKTIAYAMGNFIFDQSWSVETQQGLVGTYTFYGTKLIGATFVPIHIINQAQPTLAIGEEATAILARFHQSTSQLAELSN